MAEDSKAYLVQADKAQLSKWIGERVMEILTSPTPKEFVRVRKIGGGKTAKYVPGHFFVQKFNEAFGFLWSHKVLDWKEIEGHLVTLNELSIQIPTQTITEERNGVKVTKTVEGFTITKQQFGGHEIARYGSDTVDEKGKVTHKAGEPVDIGNNLKASATDGLKKCGLELGAFLDVYHEDDEEDSRTQEGKASKVQIEAFYFKASSRLGLNKEAADQWALKSSVGKAPKDCSNLEIISILIPRILDEAGKK